MKVRIFPSASAFRAWLDKNHTRVTELWLGFYNQRTTKKSITYKEALDEALCHGWIDGVRKSIDPITFAIRFTPRRSRSSWSQVNLKRFSELQALGRVTPHGHEVFNRRPKTQSPYSYESRPTQFPAPYRRQFRKNKTAWEFFSSQAPWYQRTSTYWVVSAKQEETRQRRLAALILDSQNHHRLKMLTPKNKRQNST